MSLVGEIVASYKQPTRVIQGQLERGISEEKTLMFALLVGVINLIAQTPVVMRDSLTQGESYANLTAMNFASYVFIAPLIMYAISFAIHLIIKAFKGQGTGVQSRRAFFWAAIVATPFVLISGIIAGFASNSLAIVSGGVTLLVFIWQYALYLREAHFKPEMTESLNADV